MFFISLSWFSFYIWLIAICLLKTRCQKIIVDWCFKTYCRCIILLDISVLKWLLSIGLFSLTFKMCKCIRRQESVCIIYCYVDLLTLVKVNPVAPNAVLCNCCWWLLKNQCKISDDKMWISGIVCSFSLMKFSLGSLISTQVSSSIRIVHQI